ncbi:MarR family transcriptional regulator [Mumia zhuanghuii]|uniref:MarR family winged helix-turn-helix transcriptional regulator n=2 Tax=Mumia TaxID=1546255 RepID=A0ABW1QLM0_9ACTN|nr:MULTISPECIES: MarR family transcriptional regulator [Mumia]KAA1423586.1 MarR family transcriptional regulator [Mumia zhuanghuii]
MPRDQFAPVSASAQRLSVDLRVIFGRLRRRLLEVTDSDDLTPSQASVLARVGKGEAVTASGLAAVERVRPQSMATLLASLEQRGLVVRTADPTDGRRQIVGLTEDGRRRVDGGRAAQEAWLPHLMQERFTEAERQTLLEAVALLDRLTE